MEQVFVWQMLMDVLQINFQTRSLEIVRADAQQGTGETKPITRVLLIACQVNMVMRLRVRGLVMLH